MCGKLTIARSILKHESQSKLFFSTDNIYNTLDFNRIRDSWLIRFWQMLGTGTATEDIANSLDHISIINFNYDRCIEQFFIQALRSLDRWSEKEAHEFVYNRMQIFHPYGVIGRLPPGNHEGGVAFGAKEVDLVPLGAAIKTYVEKIQDDGSLAKIHSAVSQAETLIFLGFHFHRQNVDLLIPSVKPQVRQIYATLYEFSLTDRNIVNSQLRSSFLHQTEGQSTDVVRLVEGDCGKLFTDFEKTLSL